jgi:hypothetical protein
LADPGGHDLTANDARQIARARLVRFVAFEPIGLFGSRFPDRLRIKLVIDNWADINSSNRGLALQRGMGELVLGG